MTTDVECGDMTFAYITSDAWFQLTTAAIHIVRQGSDIKVTMSASHGEKTFFFTQNIAQDTTDNNDYRREMYTTGEMQLVYMCLKGGETIPAEVHDDATQFFRIESGTAVFEVGEPAETAVLNDDGAAIVPAGVRHRVSNASDVIPLKMYVLYSPPEHERGTVDVRQPQ